MMAHRVSLIQPPATNTRHSHERKHIMASSTTNYALEKYEAGNSANLLDQYNGSMDKIDEAIKSVSDKADLALNNNVLPDGLAAFIEALGLTGTNAQTLGTSLNHILNRTGTEIFTVTDLSKLKKTAEGYPIPPTE